MRIPRLTAAIVILLLVSPLLSAQAQETTAPSHIVQPGDTLFRIAQIHGSTIRAIADANGIVNTSVIYVGQRLIIPTGDAPVVVAPPAQPPVVETAADAEAADDASSWGQHTVRRGDSLLTLARQYNTTISAITGANGIANPDLIYIGQVLTIPNAPPVSRGAIAGSPSIRLRETMHTIQAGETLSGIAAQYNIDWAELATFNSISNAGMIAPGLTLRIPAHPLDIPAPAARVGTGKEIIVDLATSRAFAYENGELVRAVVVSLGLPATPTVRGSFTVQRKYLSQTMSGPGYVTPNVPHILYFYAGYALHGAYWHTNWGQPMSHGCVNMPLDEAAWFYDFAPVGTPVYVG